MVSNDPIHNAASDGDPWPTSKEDRQSLASIVVQGAVVAVVAPHNTSSATHSYQQQQSAANFEDFAAEAAQTRKKKNGAESAHDPTLIHALQLIKTVTSSSGAISQKVCAIHLAFFDFKPETGAPASLDEHLGIRAADHMNVDISLAVLATVPVPARMCS
ncbi:hypothetical protein CGLO_17154 [Colletotrichum gloeosporioides Cg-14]|uniref:Uncharacterized protein n=1 Tax=Colletotrichum gloeosporioides (strain Cg-14) TaxID=1237896 RepID=T0JLQ9_COLGC|nr:hypothetical protein CGLO_17154 [Colletotrichum gloeosporioides Cg-14]